MSKYTIPFNEISMARLAEVGGKNASLGEMFQKLTPKGIQVPDGFATTASAYWKLLDENNIRESIAGEMEKLDTEEFANLNEVGGKVRELILNATIPEDVKEAIKAAYQELTAKFDQPIQVAVRSSATAEDLPTASFAGQLETFLNIRNENELLDACKNCFASLFTNRAIKYREDHGFEHLNIALSVGVQQMVRSDKACAGVGFTIDTETGFENAIVLNGAWGLGENVVQGTVTPDEFVLFKPSLKIGKAAVLSKTLGEKQQTMVYSEESDEPNTINIDTPEEKRDQYVLNDLELEKLGDWALVIEEHYGRPMDIEWAKDGVSGELFIVQARPETVHSSREPHKIYNYKMDGKGKMLTKGIALGHKIATGKARVLNSPEEAAQLQKGEVLVTDITNPDWDPVMKKAAAIVTNRGGRTSHAAIVARELGTVAVVGTANATEVIKNGQEITVSCAEGNEGVIYDGNVPFSTEEIDVREIKKPKTKCMLIMADPGKAFRHSFLPNDGVGLLRMEFIITNSIKVHPMALVNYDKVTDEKAKAEISHLTRHYENKGQYFVEKLAQSVATIAAAFYPKEVIVRMSDFKTNEYANLLGGADFEPREQNPMIGFRGASRYYHPMYREGFRLECEAMKIVRDEMGLTNVKLMIPFCRTVEEGRQVLRTMESVGLRRGENELEVYVMVELPSNVLMADQFAEIFDGFSIGSNDLTQFTLGLDRDSELIHELFNEQDKAVKKMVRMAINAAKKNKLPIGFCGQAPSDFPEFAKFLVHKGISSISFNEDALLKGIVNVQKEEEKWEMVD